MSQATEQLSNSAYEGGAGEKHAADYKVALGLNENESEVDPSEEPTGRHAAQNLENPRTVDAIMRREQYMKDFKAAPIEEMTDEQVAEQFGGLMDHYGMTDDEIAALPPPPAKKEASLNLTKPKSEAFLSSDEVAELSAKADEPEESSETPAVKFEQRSRHAVAEPAKYEGWDDDRLRGEKVITLSELAGAIHDAESGKEEEGVPASVDATAGELINMAKFQAGQPRAEAGGDHTRLNSDDLKSAVELLRAGLSVDGGNPRDQILGTVRRMTTELAAQDELTPAQRQFAEEKILMLRDVVLAMPEPTPDPTPEPLTREQKDAANERAYEAYKADVDGEQKLQDELNATYAESEPKEYEMFTDDELYAAQKELAGEFGQTVALIPAKQLNNRTERDAQNAELSRLTGDMINLNHELQRRGLEPAGPESEMENAIMTERLSEAAIKDIADAIPRDEHTLLALAHVYASFKTASHAELQNQPGKAERTFMFSKDELVNDVIRHLIVDKAPGWDSYIIMDARQPLIAKHPELFLDQYDDPAIYGPDAR